MGSSVCAALAVFLLDDYLRQHGVGEVVAGLGIVNDEIAIAAHHRGEIVERDVGARLGVVEPPVGVLLYDNRLLSSRRVWVRRFC